MTEPKIIHTVAFSLCHPQESAQAVLFLSDGRRLLTSIPGVESFEVRRQVSGKSDFQYGFSMIFKNQQTYDAYTNHPVHCDFVENRWKKEVTGFQELDFTTIVG